jgi:predicted aldo/keto reductase-like oxidoreductase
MQPLQRRRFGKTGLMVTELSLGAMNLRRAARYDQVDRVVHYALDQGVNLIDTARAYNGQLPGGETVESEVVVGRVIAGRKDLREPVVIVTKGHGYTPEKFDADLETSLAKLGVAGRHDLRIGPNPIKLVYFFHGISEERWSEMKSSGVLDKIQAVKEAGLIHYIGFSSHYKDAVEIREAIESDRFDVAELPYNIFNQSLAPLIELAHGHDLGIINMKAFGGNEMAELFRLLSEHIPIGYREMLQFCLANPFIATVDAGAIYPEQFQADIETALAPLPDAPRLEEYRRIGLRLAADLNLSELCRDCRHCQEYFACPQGIDFPTALLLLSRYRLARIFGKDAAAYSAAYRELKPAAAQCLQCGRCEPLCEYNLRIPALLQAAEREL